MPRPHPSDQRCGSGGVIYQPLFMMAYTPLEKRRCTHTSRTEETMKTRQLAILIATFLFAPHLAQAQQIGEQKNIQLFSLEVTKEWEGPPACNPRSGGDGRSWEPDSGWVVVGQNTSGVSENNGRITFDKTSGGPSFPGISSVTNQFDLLLTLARVTNNTEAAREISAIKAQWLQARDGVTQANHLNAGVWAGAHGNCFDRKRGWAKATFHATIRYVGDDSSLSKAVSDLKNKYFPNV